MDPITQGIAGAILAQTAAKKSNITQATIAGLLSGLLADADIFIRSANDPLLGMEFHRQFTHSILFIPAGALIASLLIWPFLKKQLSYIQLYTFCFLGYATAGLLDACTSFGTQLLWPFNSDRIAWNLIAIVDPLFTLGILAAVLLVWKTGKITYAFSGLAYAFLYLLLAYSQHQAAFHLQQELAQSRRHNIEKSVVKPTLGNISLWRSVYLSNGRYYVDAIKPGGFSSPHFYTGKSIPAYNLTVNNDELGEILPQYKDLRRFHTLSQGYLVVHPEEPQVIADIRYSMLPNSINPLWGIRLHPDKPGEHVSEVTYRNNNADSRKQFFTMLFGS